MDSQRIAQLSDRELQEKQTLYALQTSRNTAFIKNVLLLGIIIGVVGSLLLVVSMS